MPAQPVFVTRKFPPSVGGMETLAAGVWRSIRQARPDAVLLAHGGANRALVWWLPLTVVRVLVLALRGRAAVVLTGDALTYAVLWPLLRFLRVPSATMVMGLDVTFDNRLYQALVRPSLRAAPRVLAISEATAEQAMAAGVRAERVTVLRLGVEVPPLVTQERGPARAAVRARLGMGPSDVLLVTLGRLVRRKGARWFVTDVLPGLPPHVHYVLAGSGPEQVPLEEAAERAGVAGRLHLLGRIANDERDQLLLAADLFVQPNISVPGDMEGFGLVTVEAAMRDLPVLAADLEGIKDAVVDGGTGVLVASENPDAWHAALARLLEHPDELQRTGRRFGAEARALYSEAGMGAALCAALGLDPRPVRRHG